MIANDKFAKDYIYFINDNFDIDKHYFILYGGDDLNEYSDNIKVNIKLLSNQYLKSTNKVSLYFSLFTLFRKSNKIIIHGLRYVYLYLLNPWFLKKCYWTIVGGDLYYYKTRPKNIRHNIYEFMRRIVIRKIAHLVTGTTGDYELAKKWYGATGKHIKCFNYPSNIYKEYDIKPKEHNSINIQLGNSADPSNNHIDVLNQLLKYKDEDINIFAPLSYGDQEYAKEVISKGEKIFGDKFVALTEFMPFEKYLEFLGDIDIAIFAHKRQQAFGNTITLLGMGKKVYLDEESTLNGVFKDYNIKIYNTNNVELSLIDEESKNSNIKNVKVNFSKESLVKSLNSWIN